MALANALNAILVNTDAFGNAATSTVTPRIQLQFPYTINEDLVNTTVTGSGTITQSTPFAIASTTAATNSSATLFSKDNLHYRNGQGGLCLFTAIFTTGVSGSIQEVGLGDLTNGIFFGYNGTNFSINLRSNSVDGYVSQSNWNNDKMNGSGPSGITLNPTKGNVYKIQYQWLGFGNINFFIENGETGQFILVHQIKYSNANTTTSVLNPSMPVSFRASNTSNNTNIIVKVPSIAAFVEGVVVDLGLINCVSNRKTGITNQTNILTIKNNSTFGGITNRKFVLPIFLSLSNTSTIDAIFTLTLNTTLGGVPSFTDISTATSVVSFDVNGTTLTGGRNLMIFCCQGNNQINIPTSDIKMILNNSDTLTISATSSGAAINATAAITWSEQF